MDVLGRLHVNLIDYNKPSVASKYKGHEFNVYF